MARNHGRILTAIWSDPDFRNLDQKPQRLYLFLISQPNLDHAGVLPITLRRWATSAKDLKPGELEDLLDELDRKRFIVLDRETEELLVRTFIRNDGVFRQPKVMLAAVSSAQEIVSTRLRLALLAEMDRLPLDELSNVPTPKGGPTARAMVVECLETLRLTIGVPGGIGFDGPETLPERVSETLPGTLPETLSDTPGANLPQFGNRGAEIINDPAGQGGSGKGIGNPSANPSGYPHTGARAPSPTPRPFPVPFPQPFPPSAADESAQPAWVADPGDDTLPATAQTLIGEYIESCQERPPRQVVGQLSKLIKQMLDEGIKPERIRTGLALWKAKNLNPATLPSVVNEVMNGGGIPQQFSPGGHRTYSDPPPSVYYDPKAKP